MSDDEINDDSTMFIEGGWYVTEEKYRDDINRFVVRVNEVRAELPSPDVDNPSHLRFAADFLELITGEEWPVVRQMRNDADDIDAANARRDREKAVIDKAAKALFDRDPTLMEHVETGRYLAQALYDAGLLADGDSDGRYHRYPDSLLRDGGDCIAWKCAKCGKWCSDSGDNGECKGETDE